MKRISIYAFALLAIFASCSKTEIEAPEENGQAGPDIEVEDGQIICSIPQTKTALDDDLNVIWSEDDEIMVLGGDKQAAKYKFSSFATDDKKSAVFENVDPKVIGNRTAIYPASAYVAESYDGQEAKISLGGVEELKMPVGAVSSVLSSSTGVSALPLVSTPSEENLTFSNLFGGIMFRPYDYMGMGVNIQKLSVASTDGRAIGGIATIDIETGKITAFEGTDTELTFKCDNTSITSKKGFVAYLPAGEYPGLVITAIDNLGRKFPVTTNAMTINAGLVKKLAELPLTIWYGNTNCIVVAPGTTSVEIDATPHFTWRSDYKAEATADNVIRVENGNMSGLGGGATVLWQQEEGSTLTDLTTTNTTDGPIVNGALTIDRKLQEGKTIITVPLSGKRGNAVIALRSVLSGTPVVWSFHIWVSDINDVACNTSSMGSYYLLDRNIGATSIDGTLDSFGVNYQWGRKDPFPRILVAQSGTSVEGDALKTAGRTSSVTLNYSIQNPDTRVTYTSATGAKWLPTSVNGLWGYAEVHGSSSDALKVKSTVKTVYDPCPAGYKVPALGYLSSIGSLNTKSNAVSGKGYDMSTGTSTIFFPYSGYVRVSKTTKSNDYQSYRGYLWTVNNRSDSQGAYIFWYNADGIQANKNSTGANIYTYCGDALPVRCIKE
jgi:hypothetical protein